MNKFLFNKLMIVTGILLLSVVSCKKNNLVVDQNVVPPGFAKFNTSVLSSTYYIQANGAPYTLPIGVTTVSTKDRIINFTYTSSTGAAAGVQYNAPASVTIPAGETVGTLSIQGLFSGYPLSSRIDSLKITIAGGDEPANDYNKVYTLLLRKYCTVVLADLGGNYILNEYSSSGAFSYGPYPGAVINLTSTGATSASGQFVNLYDYGWNDINFTMDWADPANFKITIPVQATGGGGAAYVRSTAGKTNTFSSCDQTFSISLDLMSSPTAVSSSGYQIRLKR